MKLKTKKHLIFFQKENIMMNITLLPISKGVQELDLESLKNFSKQKNLSPTSWDKLWKSHSPIS